MYRIRQNLVPVVHVVYTLHDLHSPGNLSEGRETLSIVVPSPLIIQFGLVSYADKELCGGGSRFVSGHGDGSVLVFDTGDTGVFVGNDGKGCHQGIVVKATLYDIDFYNGIWLVGIVHGSIEQRTVICPLLAKSYKVCGCYRGTLPVDFDEDFSCGGFNNHFFGLSLMTSRQTISGEKNEKERSQDTHFGRK